MTFLFGRKLDANNEPCGPLLTSRSVIVSLDGTGYHVLFEGEQSYIALSRVHIVPPISASSRRALKALEKPTMAMRVVYDQERIERQQTRHLLPEPIRRENLKHAV